MNCVFNRAMALSLAGVFVAFTAACGPDEVDQNGEENQNQVSNQNQNPDPNGLPSRCDERDGSGLEIPDGAVDGTFHASYDLRMTEFAFTSDSPGMQLNSIVETFITDQSYNYPIVVLVELRDVDGAEGSFEIRGGAGLKADNEGNYVWDDEFDLPEFTDGEFHTSGTMFATLPLLNFVATIEAEEDVMKTIIPIRDLDFQGQLETDASGNNPEINDGFLRGVVVRDEVEDVRISLSPGSAGVALSQVLRLDRMNFDYNCDGEADSWLLSANFKAAETSIVGN